MKKTAKKPRTRFGLKYHQDRVLELEAELERVRAAYAAVVTSHMLVLGELTRRVGGEE